MRTLASAIFVLLCVACAYGDDGFVSPVETIVTQQLRSPSGSLLSLIPGLSGVPVSCDVHDDHCLFEGDVQMGEVVNGSVLVSGALAQSPHPTDPSSHDRRLSIINGFNAFYWPNGVVPYVYDSTVAGNALLVTIIEEAMMRYHTMTSVRFVPASGQADFITFHRADGYCNSAIGRVGGSQVVNLDGKGACPPGSVVHELGHVLGQYHTMSRTDRDSHISLNLGNVQPAYQSNYLKYTDQSGCRGQCGRDALAYDYGSVMHYSPADFANGGTTSFSMLSGPFSSYTGANGNVVVGQRVGHSTTDQALVELMYGTCVANPPPSCQSVTISGWYAGGAGTYVKRGALDGRSYWFSSSTGLYLYFSTSYGAWIVDTDTTPSNGIQDYIFAKSQFPPSGAVWLLHPSPATVTCSDAGSGAWVTNPWGTCSMSGNGGSQTRTVYCMHSGSGACLANSQCAGTMPATTQSCSVSATGCSFDNGNYCGATFPKPYPQASGSAITNDMWVLGKGGTSYMANGYPYGPSSDRSGSGKYLKMGDVGFSSQGSAVMDFPPLVTSGGSCRMSWYTNTYMGAYSVFAGLRLELMTYGSKSLVSKFYDNTAFTSVNGWVQHIVTLPVASGDVFVRMTGYKTNGYTTVLGVDDVVFSGCGTAAVLSASNPTQATKSSSPSLTRTHSVSQAVLSSATRTRTHSVSHAVVSPSATRTRTHAAVPVSLSPSTSRTHSISLTRSRTRSKAGALRALVEPSSDLQAQAVDMATSHTVSSGSEPASPSVVVSGGMIGVICGVVGVVLLVSVGIVWRMKRGGSGESAVKETAVVSVSDESVHGVEKGESDSSCV